MIRAYLTYKGLLPQKEKATRNSGAKKAAPSTFNVIPVVPPSPDPNVVESYLNFKHTGPTLEKPLVNWQDTMYSAWNARLIQLLASDFLIYVRENQLLKLMELVGEETREADFDKVIAGIGNVRRLIFSKLKNRRSKLQSSLRTITTLGLTKQADVESTLLLRKQVQAQQARRKERRTLVSDIVYQLHLRASEIIL